MRKKLSVIGNSLGFVIEKPILELLHIDRETEFEMSTDGNRLIIEPIRRNQKQEQLEHAVEKVMKKHDSTFRKLAK